MYRKRMRVRDSRKISSDRRESSRSPREIVVEEQLEGKSDAVDDEKSNLEQCNSEEQQRIGKLKQALFIATFGCCSRIVGILLTRAIRSS